MRKIFFIIILIFTTSCGYVPVYLENNTNTYNLNTINFSGDRIINRELENFLNRYENNKASKNFNLEIISSKSDTITAKDKKGNPVNFNNIINMLDFLDVDSKEIELFIIKNSIPTNENYILSFKNNIKYNLPNFMITEISSENDQKDICKYGILEWIKYTQTKYPEIKEQIFGKLLGVSNLNSSA